MTDYANDKMAGKQWCILHEARRPSFRGLIFVFQEQREEQRELITMQRAWFFSLFYFRFTKAVGSVLLLSERQNVQSN